MGRAKLKLDFISNKKSRALVFKKRKESLIKKLHQLTTLCDVDACMIIHSPDVDTINHEPEIWPRDNPDQVRRMIDLYKAPGNHKVNYYSLSDFFNDREKKVEEELVKMRKKVVEAKYPTWVEFLNLLSEGQLREFGSELACKAGIVRSRIELLKRNINVEQGMILANQSGPVNFCNNQLAKDYNDHMMRMMLMNKNNVGQFGGASSSSGSTGGDVKVFYDSMVGGGLAHEPVMCSASRPVSQYYYGPDVPLMQQAPYRGATPQQVQFNYNVAKNHQYYGGCSDDGTSQYHEMMNYGLN